MAAIVATAAGRAAADPWSDVPTMVAAAVTPLEGELRACLDRDPPRLIALYATRGESGATEVAMPFPAAAGHRGLTREEKCLMRTIAKIELPPMPPTFERVLLGYTIGTSSTFAGAWRDPAAVLAAAIDGHRAALAACDRAPRTVRLVVDLRRGRTRVWLPAWQFHSKSGDGTTPPRERRVKGCLQRAVRGWSLPALPREMAELQLAVPVAP